jgi:hypothetical protein
MMTGRTYLLDKYPSALVGNLMQRYALDPADFEADGRFFWLLKDVIEKELFVQRMKADVRKIAEIADAPEVRRLAEAAQHSKFTPAYRRERNQANGSRNHPSSRS